MKAREKILKAADSLFGELGFDASSTREIAERCGVNKALIHYHFKSKDGLLECLLDDYYAKLGTTLQGVLTADTDVRERMLTLIDSYVDFLQENSNFARIVQREASGGRHIDRIRSHMSPLFALGRRVLMDTFPGTKSGELAAEQLMISFYGMIIGYYNYAGVVSHLMSSDPMSKANTKKRKKHLRRMVEIVLEAVDGENGG